MSAERRYRSRSRRRSARKFSRSAAGRLSTTEYPRSSKTLPAWLFPAPGEAADHEQVLELGVRATQRSPLGARPQDRARTRWMWYAPRSLHSSNAIEYSRGHAGDPGEHARTLAATDARRASRSYPPSSVSATPGIRAGRRSPTACPTAS